MTADKPLDNTIHRVSLSALKPEAELISRSQAKHVASRLECSGGVELDFTGVRHIGPSFADELFRVWPLAHPDAFLTIANANDAVMGMIRRAMGRRDMPQPEKNRPAVTGNGHGSQAAIQGKAERTRMSARDREVFAIQFLLSGESPAALVAGSGFEEEEADAVIRYIRDDVPDDLAMTDPFLYRALRDRVTQLKLDGYGLKNPAARRKLALPSIGGPPPVLGVATDDEDVFAKLGFRWDRSAAASIIPQSTANVAVACFMFNRAIARHTWCAGLLEGNPLGLGEVETLLGGITVGGHRLEDQDGILGLAKGFRHLAGTVRAGPFKPGKAALCGLNAIAARRHEALERGMFRGEGLEHTYTPEMEFGKTRFRAPLPTAEGAMELNRVFAEGAAALESIGNPFERAAALFLFGCRHQFFFEGNLRTSWLAMEGVLLSNCIDPIDVPADKTGAFNGEMTGFLESGDGKGMMRFLASYINAI